MKANIENSFEAFDLKVTVENEDELRYLWHLFNMSVPRSDFQNTDLVEPPKSGVSTYGIWKKLDNRVIMHDIKLED